MKKFVYILIAIATITGGLFIFQEYKNARAADLSSARNYVAAPSRTGLVGWWTMDANDVSGTKVIDKSGQNNHGTSVNTPTAVAGKLGQALNFTTSQYINAGNGNSLRPGTGSFSACSWIKSDQTGTTYLAVSKSDGGTAGTSIGWWIGWATAGSRWSFNVSDSGDAASPTDSAARKANQWYFVCGTFNGATGAKTATLYVDGVQSATASDTDLGDINTNSVFTIAGYSGSAYWDGQIDDVRYYNYLLTAQEVANLYSAAKTAYVQAPSRTGLVGWWTLDQNDVRYAGTATTTYDKSGNKVNCTFSIGTNTYGATSTQGKIGQAISFDGVNDGLSCAGGYDTNGKSYSISAWIKLKNGSPAEGMPIVGLCNSGSWGSWPNGGFLQQTGGTIVALTHYSGAYKTTASTISLPLNEWTLVTGTYDASVTTQKVYINGVYNAQNASAAAPGQSHTTWTIGDSNSSNAAFDTNFDGSIDDVRIYNRALSAQEVANLYSAAKVNYIQ